MMLSEPETDRPELLCHPSMVSEFVFSGCRKSDQVHNGAPKRVLEGLCQKGKRSPIRMTWRSFRLIRHCVLWKHVIYQPMVPVGKMEVFYENCFASSCCRVGGDSHRSREGCALRGVHADRLRLMRKQLVSCKNSCQCLHHHGSNRASNPIRQRPWYQSLRDCPRRTVRVERHSHLPGERRGSAARLESGSCSEPHQYAVGSSLLR